MPAQGLKSIGVKGKFQTGIYVFAAPDGALADTDRNTGSKLKCIYQMLDFKIINI